MKSYRQTGGLPLGCAGRNCLSFTAGLALAFYCSAGTIAAEVMVEAKAPVIDTKVELAKTNGNMYWLDADTLAIGTFRTDINEFWQGRIVAYDTREKRSKELRDNAFLQCTLPHSGIVAVTLGNYEEEYLGSGAKNPIKPKQVFYKWKSGSDELTNETAFPNADWNWFICRQVQPEHLKSPSVDFYSRGIRYLLPAEGVLEWGNVSRSAEGQPVTWTKTGQAPKSLDLFSDEIALVPQFLPFANRYILSSGKVAIKGALMQSREKQIKQFPLVTMSRTGEIARTELPGDVVAQIDSLGSEGVTYLSAAGLVVATDRGILVIKDQSIKRVWCGPNGLNGKSCDLAAFEISPDGCKIALAPKYRSIQVINVCTKSVP